MRRTIVVIATNLNRYITRPYDDDVFWLDPLNA